MKQKRERETGQEQGRTRRRMEKKRGRYEVTRGKSDSKKQNVDVAGKQTGRMGRDNDWQRNGGMHGKMTWK